MEAFEKGYLVNNCLAELKALDLVWPALCGANTS